MSGWAILFWLIVAFGCLFPLKRWINIHVHGIGFLLTNSQPVAVWFYWVLFLPGTFLHEMSHWLAAVLLRVPITKFSLWPEPKKNGHLQMGSVEILVSDPFRHALIGLAPLIIGSLTVFLIGQGWLRLSEVALALRSGEADQFFTALGTVLTVPDVWLWLYLIFAISNAMLPSASDREAWASVALYLLLAVGVVIALDIMPTLSPDLEMFGLTVLRYLLYAFVITIAVDLFFILVIALIEAVLVLFRRRQVQYNR